MRLGIIETIGWVALYLGLAGFVLLYRGGSPVYRAVVLEQTATDWIENRDLSYVPGTPILGNERSPYFAGGWWWREPKCRWGRDALATIEVEPTTELPAGTPVSGHIGALAGGTIERQEVTIALDGEPMAMLPFSSLEEQQRFDFALPEAVAAGSPIRVSFRVRQPSTMVFARLGDDTRFFGVKFYDMAIGAGAASLERNSKSLARTEACH